MMINARSRFVSAVNGAPYVRAATDQTAASVLQETVSKAAEQSNQQHRAKILFRNRHAIVVNAELERPAFRPSSGERTPRVSHVKLLREASDELEAVTSSLAPLLGRKAESFQPTAAVTPKQHQSRACLHLPPTLTGEADNLVRDFLVRRKLDHVRPPLVLAGLQV
jgi:hypothetical protein